MKKSFLETKKRKKRHASRSEKQGVSELIQLGLDLVWEIYAVIYSGPAGSLSARETVLLYRAGYRKFQKEQPAWASIGKKKGHRQIYLCSWPC